MLIKLSDIIKADEAVYEASTVQSSEIPKELIEEIRNIQAAIPSDKLYEGEDSDDGWVVKGIQELLHITILYGVRAEDKDKIEEVWKEFKDIEISCESINYFDNDEFTVAYVECESPDLEALHNALREAVPNRHRHGDYRPHITIAYLKANERLDDSLLEHTWSTDEIELSTPKGKVISLKQSSVKETKKKALQAIRFSKDIWSEQEAGKWWETVKDKKGFEKLWSDKDWEELGYKTALKRQCAWCRKYMGDKPPYDDESITHGMCAECLHEMKSDNAWLNNDLEAPVVHRDTSAFKISSILDYPKPGLCPEIWNDEGVLHKEIEHRVVERLLEFFKTQNINLQEDDVIDEIYIIGSLTSYQYNSRSDLDIHVHLLLNNVSKILETDNLDELAEVINKTWRKYLNSTHSETVGDTLHPMEFYFEMEGYTSAEPTDGVYDLFTRQWVKEPRTVDVDFDVREIHPEVIDFIKNLLKEFDSEIGETKRDIDDVEYLQESIKAFGDKQVFRDKLIQKIKEIDSEINILIEKGIKVIDDRKKNYDPMSEGNIKFKFFQRYNYLTLVKALEKVLENPETEKIEVKTEDDVKEVKKVVDDFEKHSDSKKISIKMEDALNAK